MPNDTHNPSGAKARPPSTLTGWDDVPLDAARRRAPGGPAGCPRCAAEGLARWAYSGTQVTGTMAGVLLLVAPRLRRDDTTGGPTLAALLGLMIALACLAWGLHHVTRRLDRRASMPLPAPAVDTLAHYRDGPTWECPRHPFVG